MKKLFSYCIISGLSLFLFACTKNKIETPKSGTEQMTYVGQTTGYYDYSSLNLATGERVLIKWDTTYKDTIRVKIDYDLKKIKFSRIRMDYQRDYYSEDFEYDLSEATYYMTKLHSHSMQSFIFSGQDGLTAHYDNYMGYDYNYDKSEVDFTGSKLP